MTTTEQLKDAVYEAFFIFDLPLRGNRLLVKARRDNAEHRLEAYVQARIRAFADQGAKEIAASSTGEPTND